MMFPVEPVPDGTVAAPHHLYTGAILAVFAFGLIWPHYPQTGAVLSLLGVLIALDDVLSHAFGIWTPLDWFWTAVLLGVVQ